MLKRLVFSQAFIRKTYCLVREQIAPQLLGIWTYLTYKVIENDLSPCTMIMWERPSKLRWSRLARAIWSNSDSAVVIETSKSKSSFESIHPEKSYPHSRPPSKTHEHALPDSNPQEKSVRLRSQPNIQCQVIHTGPIIFLCQRSDCKTLDTVFVSVLLS